MSDFKRNLRRAQKEIEDKIEKTVKAVALDLLSEIVRRTPVGQPGLWKSDPPPGYTGGRLRANWQATVRSPARDEVRSTDPTGSQTAKRAKAGIGSFRLKDRYIYLTNNLPYAERVEFGWSQQRPQGMMRTTVKQFKALLEKRARENRR